MTWPIQDNFNRADADVLGSMSDGVHSWTEIAGDIDIVSNQAKVGVGGQGSIAKVVESHSETDYYVQASCIKGGAQAYVGVAARLIDVDNFYLWAMNTDDVKHYLFKRVGGTWTLLASTTDIPATATLKLEVNGTTIKGYINGVEKVSVIDSSLTSGAPGIRGYYINDAWDDFYADLLVAAGAKNYYTGGFMNAKRLTRGL